MAQFLDYTGLGHFKDKNDALYAKQNGSYEQMTVGNAEQLVSTVGVEDSAPYTFRTTGGSADVGDRMNLKTVVGGTVAWNQLVSYNNVSTQTSSGVTFTKNADSYAVSGTATGRVTTSQNVIDRFIALKGHKYFVGLSQSIAPIRLRAASGFSNGLITNSIVVDCTAETNMYFSFDSLTEISDTFNIAKLSINIIDLTLALGSAIADYVYTLESGTAGAGIAWLKKYGFFTKPYYPYAAASLQSVKTSAHKTIGFNQWDEVWEKGAYAESTGAKVTDNDDIRSKNYIPVLPSTAYHKTILAAGKRLRVFYYDADKNYIDYNTNNETFTTPANCYYLTLCTMDSYGATYTNDICINISWDGERDGEYEPYEQHTYALDDVELRGILKLDANNNLYADGDIYQPSGEVQRTINQITINGSEAWYKDPVASDGLYDSYYIQHDDLKKLFDYRNCFLTNKGYYVAVGYNTFVNDDNGILVVSGYQINAHLGYNWLYLAIKKDVGCDTSEKFKEWLSNNPFDLIYELETPTTESADPYTELQICDDFGTEEFVDAAVESGERDVAIPVGNETVYKPNLRAKLEMAPNSPDGDGDYIVRQTNGVNEYVLFSEVKELPDMPTEDGTYVLKCTVADGTATLFWVSE